MSIFNTNDKCAYVTEEALLHLLAVCLLCASARNTEMLTLDVMLQEMGREEA